jgi:uncharacterized protein (DUF302 family)
LRRVRFDDICVIEVDRNPEAQNMKSDYLITRTTAAALDSVCQSLPEIAQRHRFGVLGMHNLKEKMASKGVAFGRECRVFEVCNPHQAKEVLSRAMEISTALPCRISVYEEGGRTVLATLKPTILLGLFDAPGAAPAAQEVEDTIVKIMDEAAGNSPPNGRAGYP